jgi:DNA-binding NarL/FixJ family response regulator
MARAVVLSADLLFGSHVQSDLQAAGHEVRLVASRDALEGNLDCDVLVVDLTDERLQGPDLVEALGAEAQRPRTLGFYSHVDTKTRDRARQAGFDLVVPRSRMAREGGELVGRLAALP